MTCADRSGRSRRSDPVNDRLDRDLLSGKPKRWTAQRKAAVIRAICRKVISVWDACERYDLSAAELAEWKRDLDRFGIPGLRSTKILYRKTSASK
jgi:transposase-like protein